MEVLLWIIGATVIDSLLGLAGIFSFWVRPATLEKAIKFLVAFSAGALLGGGLFHLLAESLDGIRPLTALGIFTAGFLAFFILEEYLHWHHCEKCDIHPYSYLMIVGDCIHNFIDGLLIAGVFATSIPLGIVTALMVLGHELPQELGVFAVIVSGGIAKEKAILYSFLAQLTAILGGILGWFFISQFQLLSFYILPFAAGGFIYIAAADLIPTMHKTKGWGKVTSFIWLCLGLLFMVGIKILFEA